MADANRRRARAQVRKADALPARDSRGARWGELGCRLGPAGDQRALQSVGLRAEDPIASIAPLLIGDGRPAIRLSPRLALSDCHRPRYRVFRMGADVLFDCELGSDASDAPIPPNEPPITRVI